MNDDETTTTDEPTPAGLTSGGSNIDPCDHCRPHVRDEHDPESGLCTLSDDGVNPCPCPGWTYGTSVAVDG